MSKYLDGIQAIDDKIKEFNTVASGTLNVGVNQYPQTATVNRPTELYRNYILLAKNSSGQNITSAIIIGITTEANKPVPNTNAGIGFQLKIIGATPAISASGYGSVDLTSEEPNPFSVGNLKIQFNLQAAPTSGTIDWALIGY